MNVTMDGFNVPAKSSGSFTDRQRPGPCHILNKFPPLARNNFKENKALRDEIDRLKGEKTRPTIKPSSLEVGRKESQSSGKRPGSAKRHKTQFLEIH